MAYRSNIPNVNEVGRLLETEGLVTVGKRPYIQTSGNCFEIASRLADLFGYRPPASKKELADLILIGKEWRKGLNPNTPAFNHRSPVYLIVREPDNPVNDHVALEAYGREYNYGYGTREGFTTQMRIPLFRQP